VLALVHVSTDIYYGIPSRIDSNRRLLDEFSRAGIRKEPVLQTFRCTTDSLSNDFFSALDKINAIIITMEKYEISLPDFLHIRVRISEKSQELSKAFNAYYVKVLQVVPLEAPKDNQQQIGKIFNFPTPSQEKIDEIKKLGDEYQRVVFDLMAFLHDLRIEAQNSLLSHLFNRTVEPRKPQDPRYEVLTIKRS
jgi:hypothetical protein